MKDRFHNPYTSCATHTSSWLCFSKLLYFLVYLQCLVCLSSTMMYGWSMMSGCQASSCENGREWLSPCEQGWVNNCSACHSGSKGGWYDRCRWYIYSCLCCRPHWTSLACRRPTFCGYTFSPSNPCIWTFYFFLSSFTSYHYTGEILLICKVCGLLWALPQIYLTVHLVWELSHLVSTRE